MAISPLKFSFGISVLVHGLVISGVAWLGQFHRPAAGVEAGTVTTLKLIAAPAAPTESLPQTVTAPPWPAPVAPPIAPQNIPPPPEAMITAPVAGLESAPEAVSTPVTSAAVAEAQKQSAAPVGDGSSPQAGADVTTAAGRQTALARPNYLRNQEPEYPLAARRRGQQGVVLLEVTVSPAGRATAATVKQSSGFELLDRAALRAVAEYEFEPARLGATAVESRIEVPIRFKLNR